MKKLLTIALLLVLGAALGQAAEEALKVWFNGQPTALKTVEVTGGRTVPISFPVEEGERVYEVRLFYDPGAHELKIERKPLKPKVRGDDPCYYCTGGGKCQNCFPVGSGVTASGATCTLCNGSSKCAWCAGSGKQ